ncbi:MAG: hemerythrin family protein [Candidatus Lambdaproteobacteria bacterium]|nr:hemerythrin family protein [Candidatus Lambdaproteobacteria bacterium]
MAPYFEWLDKYSVGVPSLDDDHRALIGLVDQVVTAIEQGRGHDVVAPVLDRLMDYTVSHFEHEERLMAKSDYPRYVEHVQQHNMLIRRVLTFSIQYGKGEIDPVEFGQFLMDWLLKHVLHEDQQYKAHLMAAGVS